MRNVAPHLPSRPVDRLEEQDPDPQEALWERAVRDVEDEGEALGVEALARTPGDPSAAETWLMTMWRPWPDARERAVRNEALAVVAYFRARTPALPTSVAA